MSDYLLPEEILIEILIKLPVKSLIRFTSVCKQWGCLIRSPYFISTHLSNTTQNQAFLQRYDTKEHREHYAVIPKRGPLVINSDSELEFPFKSQMRYFRIVGSCDGLVCLSDLQHIIIFNPTIRRHVVLPRSLIDPREIHPFALGFGVGSNSYKVVRLLYGRYPQAEIFYLHTRRWRKLTGFDHVRGLIPQYQYRWCPIFFDGFVHWIACRSIIDNSVRNSILTFHVGDEVFGEIMLPEELERATLGTRVGLSMMGENLGAFTICDDHIDIGNPRCDVWMMKDYGVKESWTKLYTIDTLRFMRVIGFWGSSEALLVVRGQELATYNPETKWIRHVMHSGDITSSNVNDYKESLVLLGGGGYSGDSGEEVIA